MCRVQPQRAEGRSAEIVEVVERVVDVAKRRRDAREELLPRLGQRDTARRPVDEPQVQALLQCPQLMAERRWRDAKLVGGASKALMPGDRQEGRKIGRSEEHTSELQSLMRNSYAVFCFKKKTHTD